MNTKIPHDRLLANAKSAMIAAIEIYNKPTALYRDECVVILILNAWELALKAILSKNGRSIFLHDKKKFTLSWKEALEKARSYFPKDISYTGIRENISILDEYRNDSIHFYNEKDFGIILYSLFRTSILNFRDLVCHCLEVDIEDMVTWKVLPIAFDTPVDVVSYLSDKSTGESPSHMKQFFSKLAKANERVKGRGGDTGRLMTVFNVQLNVVKKIGDADTVINFLPVKGKRTKGNTVEKFTNPNETHPHRMKEVVAKVKLPKGVAFTSKYICQVVNWKYDIRSKRQYCWKAKSGGLTLYSNDYVTWVNRLTKKDIEIAIADYSEHRKRQRQRKKKSI
ncbi:MAG: DUF3644 domain-containing protein [Gammaproteobacteria bacterium]|nr:DUF3644 domain-containing protein [Gammaproteobacteria bacterium]